jgi:hypothetical protein
MQENYTIGWRYYEGKRKRQEFIKGLKGACLIVVEGSAMLFIIGAMLYMTAVGTLMLQYN